MIVMAIERNGGVSRRSDEVPTGARRRGEVEDSMWEGIGVTGECNGPRATAMMMRQHYRNVLFREG